MMADDKVVVDRVEPAAPSQDAGTSAGAGKEPIKVGGKEYGSWEDVGKAYEEVQKELGKWTQQHGDLKKQYDEVTNKAGQWDQWWKTVAPLWDQDVEGLLQRKLASRNGQAQPVQKQPDQTGQDRSPYDGFELLRPEEQAARIQQHVLTQVQEDHNRKFAEFAQAVNQSLTQKEAYYQNYITNYLQLMRRAMEQKQENKDFDIDKTLEAATKAIGGQIDPIELGKQLIDAASFQARLESAKKESYEQGKKDWEQAQTNKKQETVPVDAGVPKYVFPTGTKSSRPTLGSMRQRAAEAIVKQFGPGVFARE